MLNRLQGVFKSLQDHEVRYLVIGGIAAVLHGVPRATFDLDILIEATRENARRLLAAFLDAGLGTAALTNPEELLANEITVFNDRIRIDVQTATPGLDFEEAWGRRESMSYQEQPLYVVSREDLTIQRSSGNVFTDLGFEPEEALNLKLRSDLMIEISKLIEERDLTQTAAAKLFKVTQPRISDLVRGKIDRFSVDSLIEILGHAGAEVSFVVKGSRQVA